MDKMQRRSRLGLRFLDLSIGCARERHRWHQFIAFIEASRKRAVSGTILA